MYLLGKYSGPHVKSQEKKEARIKYLINGHVGCPLSLAGFARFITDLDKCLGFTNGKTGPQEKRSNV